MVSNKTGERDYQRYSVASRLPSAIAKIRLDLCQLIDYLTPSGLLPSQYVIGGSQSLRGYRQNACTGDNRVRFSLEDCITLKKDESGNSMLQIALFFDAGAIWNVNNNPNQLQKQKFLAGVGLGVL
jgi:hemolysin activation/secretion protein